MTDYLTLNAQLKELLKRTTYEVSVLANASAILFQSMDNINWAGFYILNGTDLILGPFQGKVACTVIRVGNGVCGTAVAENRAICVDDVHQFPGHIACDSDSKSEIVIPIYVGEKIYGVLDIDSPVTSRFSLDDVNGLKEFVGILEYTLNSIVIEKTK